MKQQQPIVSFSNPSAFDGSQASFAAPPSPAFSAGQKYLHDFRIHVENGSLIDKNDPLVIIHRSETAPPFLPILKQKIVKAYTLDAPGFFADDKKAHIAGALAGFIPLSDDARKTRLSEMMLDWLKELNKGEDADFTKWQETHHKPFASIISSRLAEKDIPPEIREFTGNGVAMYLMVSEALKRRGHDANIEKLAEKGSTDESVVSILMNHLGIDFASFQNVAGAPGSDTLFELGALLGLEESYVTEVKQLVDALPRHHYSANAVANWQEGRNLPGLQGPGETEEKIKAGAEIRASKKIQRAQQAFSNSLNRDAAPDLQAQEYEVAAAIDSLPPALSEAMYLLGAEVVYTPSGNLGPVLEGKRDGSAPYGLHRHVLRHPDSMEDGIYQVFVSGKASREEFRKVLTHEFDHLLLLPRFSRDDIARVDDLAGHDSLRLKALDELMEQWEKAVATGNPAGQREVLEILDRPEFAINGRRFSEVIGSMDMQTFHDRVRDAAKNLDFDSDWFHAGPYHSDKERFLELNSRFSEQYYVTMKDRPDVLQFIAPGLMEIHRDIYLPHLEDQLQNLRIRAAQRLSNNVASLPVEEAPPITFSAPVGAASRQQDDAAYAEGPPTNHISTHSMNAEPMLYRGIAI